MPNHQIQHRSTASLQSIELQIHYKLLAMMNLRNNELELSSTETQKKQVGLSWHRRITSSSVIILLMIAFVAILPFLILHNIVVHNETLHQTEVYLRNLRTQPKPEDTQPQRPENNLVVQSDFLATQKKDWDPSNSAGIGMDQLKQLSFPHGTFFFGVDSHQMKIPESEIFDPSDSWLPSQRELLEDDDDSEEIINVEEEKKRCKSYGFKFPKGTMPPRRRRLFYGALISDDSKEVIKATSMEQYNIFHTVSLIESNKTFNLTPKKWRFFGTNEASKELSWLYQIYGPKTRVSMDYYTSSLEKEQEEDAMYPERYQREGHSYRFKFNGMRPDDVAIIGDLDETYSRDFLRALQICDVKQFRPGQDCRSPKLYASTLIFESSPECAWKGRRWFHPG
jgi:hypothetical protein